MVAEPLPFLKLSSITLEILTNNNHNALLVSKQSKMHNFCCSNLSKFVLPNIFYLAICQSFPPYSISQVPRTKYLTIALHIKPYKQNNNSNFLLTFLPFEFNDKLFTPLTKGKTFSCLHCLYINNM